MIIILKACSFRTMESQTVIRFVTWIVVIFLGVSIMCEGRKASPELFEPLETESIVSSSYSILHFASLNWTSNIKKYIQHEEFRLRVIKNFTGYEDEVPFVKKRIAEFKIIHKSLLKNATAKKFYTSLRENHPTTVLAALRNFLAAWEEKLANTTVYGKRLREFLEANNTKPLPTRRDLTLTATALSIIQATYNLSIADLVKGQVLGKKGEQLSNADCYDIGTIALRTGLIDTAYEWLEAAVSKYDVEKINISRVTFNLSDALASIARIAFKRKNQSRALKLFEKANELDPDNLSLYQEYVQHRFGRNVTPLPELNRENVEPWRKKYYDMCQNSTNSTWLLKQRLLQTKLTCRLRFSKSVPYLAYKEEILSKSPYISLILDFITKNQSEQLQNETLPLLREAVLPGFDPYVLWHYKAGYFKDHSYDSVGHLSQLAGELTGLNVSQKDETNFVGEPVHVIDFGISGLVLPHDELAMKYNERYIGQSRGKRFATLHVYLSDVAAGGVTVFIEQNITVIPKQGSAILWYNYKPSGEPETGMLSATCPLAVGHNIVLEKGIWLVPNDATSFCGRSPKSTFATAGRIQACHPSLCRQNSTLPNISV